MRDRLLAIATGTVIAIGALAAAVLLSHAVLSTLVPALAGVVGVVAPAAVMPAPVEFAARGLLWPFTRPFGHAPLGAGGTVMFMAALVYMVATLAIVVALAVIRDRHVSSR